MATSAFLLRDEGGGAEGSSYLWVANDSSGVIVGEPVVPRLDPLHHPLLECLTNEGVDDVADILPWHLADLTHARERVDDLSEGHAIVNDVIKREALILGDCDVLDVLASDFL